MREINNFGELLGWCLVDFEEASKWVEKNMARALLWMIEISDFGDWMRWSGTGQEALRWMEENKDTWVLLWLTFAYGTEEALKRFEIYSNAPNKSEHFDRALNDYWQVLEKAKEILEEQIAEEAITTRSSGSNGENSEVSGVRVRDPEDQGQGGENGEKAIEC